ncbi:hypothetical protein ACFOUP_04795 [Belliella kenyensis]|uniref:Type II toxin-antitoxin system RelE/ParE family toxin n=1 Tax=Belliella kenyensis TaxID=1472724 RepID=A0ABV8EIQ0_9BACT|nr:hypothetical protein [Belliella kenyensis]MCH7403484.1 hypothetical protein [Belliella kenyensis]MDN3602384.1 hypothetical protein [Belliella kenyensis]
MYNAIILPLAKVDISLVSKWYNDREKGLELKFIHEVKAKVKNIQKNPLASNIRYQSVRTAALNISPFTIHYVFDEDSNSFSHE